MKVYSENKATILKLREMRTNQTSFTTFFAVNNPSILRKPLYS